MKSEKRNSKFRGGTLAVIGAILLVGCAQEAIVVAPAPLNKWVQRDVVITAPDFEIESSEFVGVDGTFYKIIGPEERVIWVAGVDHKTSKLQRSKSTVDQQKHQKSDDDKYLVTSSKFQITNNDLSVEALFAIDKFEAQNTDRFYVEFLNKGEMSESNVDAGMKIWKNLMQRLSAKGLNSKNVIMGGARYNQPVDAIVLVKVGI